MHSCFFATREVEKILTKSTRVRMHLMLMLPMVRSCMQYGYFFFFWHPVTVWHFFDLLNNLLSKTIPSIPHIAQLHRRLSNSCSIPHPFSFRVVSSKIEEIPAVSLAQSSGSRMTARGAETQRKRAGRQDDDKERERGWRGLEIERVCRFHVPSFSRCSLRIALSFMFSLHGSLPPCLASILSLFVEK